MRKIILTVLGILLIIAAIFAAKAIIANKYKPKPKVAKVVKTVFVDTVKNGVVPIRIKAQGNLLAKRRVALFSEVQGVFKSGAKPFKTGQVYRKGMPLIRMDATEFYASVQSAKSRFYNLITSIMPDLQLDYPEAFEKWQKYLDNFDIKKTVQVLPEAISDKEKYFISGRGIHTMYYDVKNLEQRLSKYTIKAPFTGVLNNALVTEGTLIRPGQELGTFIETGIYEMEIAISKEYAQLLEVGATVALMDASTSKNYTGHVVRVNGSIDQTTQTITAFIEVKDAMLKEGIYLEAILNARKEAKAIAIDRSLLQRDHKVFVVRDSVLDLIDTTPVFFSDKKVVIKGVRDGTLLMSKNIPGAYVGMLVRIYKGKEAAASTKSEATDTKVL